MIRRMKAISLACAAATALSAQQSAPPQAPPSMKGAVIKGRAPVATNVLEIKLPPAEEADLPNDAHLMVLEDHRVPLVSFQILISGAGGYYDPTDQPGLADFTASMMREGTSTRSALQIAEQLETMAASVSVGTGMASQVTTLSGSSLTANFDMVLDLAADMLLHPTFPGEELERLKLREKADLLQERSDPAFLADELFSRVVYGSHPAGRVSTSLASLEKTRREDLAAFHRRTYIPDHAVIGVVGDITMSAARQKLGARLAGWTKTGAPAPEVADPEPARPARVYFIDRPDSVQTSLVVGTQAISRTSPDYDVLAVMNKIVGGGPTGRLFLNLREDKGFTYGASSAFTALRYRGDWQASTDVRTEVTEPALKELLNELARLRDERVPDKEFADAKRSMVAGFALSLESPATLLGNHITRWLYRLPVDYWDRYPDRVMGVTAAQVQAAAGRYLDRSRMQIVAVGDGQRIGDTLKKFGPVEAYDTDGKKKGPLSRGGAGPRANLTAGSGGYRGIRNTIDSPPGSGYR